MGVTRDFVAAVEERAVTIQASMASPGHVRTGDTLMSPPFPIKTVTIYHRLAVIIGQHCGVAFTWSDDNTGRFYGIKADMIQAKRFYDWTDKGLTKVCRQYAAQVRPNAPSTRRYREAVTSRLGSMLERVRREGVQNLALREGVFATNLALNKAMLKMYLTLINVSPGD